MNPRHRTIRIVTIVLGIMIIASLALSLVSCSSDGGGSVKEFQDDAVDRTDVIAGIADEVIVPAFENLAAAAKDLTTTAAALCAAPSDDGLVATKEAWSATRTAWKHTEAFRFGPAKDLHSIGQIAYPIDTEKVDALFSGPDTLTEPVTAEAVSDLGADVRGLNGIEQVLFSAPDATALTAAQCAYVSAAAVDVQAGADELLVAWTEGVDGDEAFVDQFTSPGGDSMYASEQEVVNDLVNGSIGALTTIADMMLGTASGATTGEPDPSAADAGAAHAALADAADALWSVQAVYGTSEGGEDSADDVGLSVLVAEQSLSTDRRVLANLADAAAAIDAVPAPLASLDPGDAASVALVQDAYDQVTDARVAMRTSIASLLGVTVGFSDSDGDG